MNRAAWPGLVAARAALETLHSGAAVLLPQLLDPLTEAAARHPGHLARVTEWHTAAADLLSQQDDVLGDLERAIAAVESPNDAGEADEPRLPARSPLGDHFVSPSAEEWQVRR